MSMTREEAITQLELLLEYCESMMTSEYPVWRRDCEALRMLIAALRPVSREQIEQVWRGCEYCSGDVDNRSYLDSKRLYLDGNGILTDEIENIDILRLDFCPICGKPLTDEAVDIVMEKWKDALNEH